MKQYPFLEQRLEDIKAEIDLPVDNNYFRYGSDEYWKRLESDLKYAAEEFEEFIRDHRSRDGYVITLKKTYIYVCKHCGWEYPDGFNGVADCCEDALKDQEISEIVRE